MKGGAQRCSATRDSVSETTNKESCAWVLQRSGGQPPSRCNGPQEGYTPRFLGCESEAACPSEQSYLQQTKNHVLGSYNGPGGSPRPVTWVLQRTGGQPPSRCDGPHQPHEDSLVDVGWSMAPPPRRRSHGGPRVRDRESETAGPKPQVRDRESDRELESTAEHDAEQKDHGSETV